MEWGWMLYIEKESRLGLYDMDNMEVESHSTAVIDRKSFAKTPNLRTNCDFET